MTKPFTKSWADMIRQTNSTPKKEEKYATNEPVKFPKKPIVKQKVIAPRKMTESQRREKDRLSEIKRRNNHREHMHSLFKNDFDKATHLFESGKFEEYNFLERMTRESEALFEIDQERLDHDVYWLLI